VAPASPWFDPTIKCTPYDPKDARRLVAASGVDPTVHLKALPTDLLLAQFIQAQEAAVGITVVIDPPDLTAGITGKFDTFMGGLAGRPDPDNNMYSAVHTLGVRNYSGYSNRRLDLILENARTAKTKAERATLYRVAQQIVLHDRPLIYLGHQTRDAAFRSTQVTGVQLGPEPTLRVAFAQLK